MLSKEQYDFSNMFFEDQDWEDSIPKYFEVDDNDNTIFHYLEGQELKQFMQMKAWENPEVLQDIRYKKIMRVLNEN